MRTFIAGAAASLLTGKTECRQHPLKIGTVLVVVVPVQYNQPIQHQQKRASCGQTWTAAAAVDKSLSTPTNCLSTHRKKQLNTG